MRYDMAKPNLDPHAARPVTTYPASYARSYGPVAVVKGPPRKAFP